MYCQSISRMHCYEMKCTLICKRDRCRRLSWYVINMNIHISARHVKLDHMIAVLRSYCIELLLTVYSPYISFCEWFSYEITINDQTYFTQNKCYFLQLFIKLDISILYHKLYLIFMSANILFFSIFFNYKSSTYF